jgi:hypothetical protein
MRVCVFCGNSLDDTLEVFRSSTCPSCDRELKICLNCRFYKKGAHWDCLETIPEPVAEKERANFCDYFRFREGARGSSPSAGKSRQARDSFDKLFGNGL